MVFRRSWMDKKDPRYGSALPRLALPRPPQIRAGQGHQWRPRRYWPLTPRPWKRRTAYVGARGEPSPGSGAEGRDGELGRVHEELVALRIKVGGSGVADRRKNSDRASRDSCRRGEKPTASTARAGAKAAAGERSSWADTQSKSLDLD